MNTAQSLRVLVLVLMTCMMGGLSWAMEEPELCCPNPPSSTCCEDPIESITIEWLSTPPCIKGQSCASVILVLGTDYEISVTFKCETSQFWYPFLDYNGLCGPAMCGEDEAIVGDIFKIRYGHFWLPSDPVFCGSEGHYANKQAVEDVPTLDKCDFPGTHPFGFTQLTDANFDPCGPTSWPGSQNITTSVNCGDPITADCQDGFYCFCVGEIRVGYCPFPGGQNRVRYMTQFNGCGGVRLTYVEHEVYQPAPNANNKYPAIRRYYYPTEEDEEERQKHRCYEGLFEGDMSVTALLDCDGPDCHLKNGYNGDENCCSVQ